MYYIPQNAERTKDPNILIQEHKFYLALAPIAPLSHFGEALSFAEWRKSVGQDVEVVISKCKK